MNVSLSTTAKASELLSSVTEVYQYLTDSVENGLSAVGSEIPAAELQDRPWIKTTDDGEIDGVFAYHNANWHSPMPSPIGLVALFESGSTASLGWESISGITNPDGFVYRKFTGAGLLVVGSVAFRRYDQPLA